MKETRKLNEDDIYKDAPGLDPELEWAEEEYWMKLIMKEKIEKTAGELVAINAGGTVRNLLITDDKPEFLNDALCVLREWALVNRINLVEVDEKDDSWLPEIQSRELFDKLNLPNTVLIIKNYATTTWASSDDNTPSNFLYDAVVNRHYGCGNDFVPSDELPNLLFVVAINDRSLMHWQETEYGYFSILLEDECKKFWIDTNRGRHHSQMYPVMSRFNKVIYFVSEDCKVLSVDLCKAFRRVRSIKYRSQEDRTDMIHTYINNNVPHFHDKVEHIIVKLDRFEDYERFTIDAARLREAYPNMKSIDCSFVFDVSNADASIEVCDPFELGERAFDYAQKGDFKTADFLTRRLWDLDHKWAKFFREVAVDYQCPHEHHERCYPDGNVSNTGLDKLFRIYLLGWCSKNGDFKYEQRLYVEKHRNIDKAAELLKVRFKNWERHEIMEKLRFDLEHVEIFKEYCEDLVENKDRYSEEYVEYELEMWSPDYSSFMRAVIATDKLYPGTIDEMYSDERFFRFFNDSLN